MFAPGLPMPNNVSLIRKLADAIASKRNDPLPTWKLVYFNGGTLQWHQWYVHFKSLIVSQSVTDDFKWTYLS